ncbi:amino acid-binding protein [Desulfobacter hydrogenophilus]|uniref:Amino acid-binding protein n=1 Tax=Desulfobacter hydrogenophilus TaxID=2291 RepID=A0A328FB43_9BACT|nr:ACT domain-containing protein [Desulfobacter hydrogenophilus]NDY72695.1 amino acid-binding protein [Desulfobacter hydrogenophilus]QBH14488.1 amino acid-binding protein [Desulfobacter hydrogenophilus]RAM01456.1 amino acid-binding protein [Desulfobacter hydrogenophilus]
MNKMIISVLAKDRPGIIASVTSDLCDLGCNLENVNQMILQNQFAGFFIVQAPEGVSAETIRQELTLKEEANGLTIHVRSLEGDTQMPVEEKEIFLITTSGPDQKGLVAQLSDVISSFGANIVNLKAVFMGGSNPNENVMSYQVPVTKEIDAPALFAALKEKAKKLDLDIRIQHKNIFDVTNKI